MPVSPIVRRIIKWDRFSAVLLYSGMQTTKTLLTLGFERVRRDIFLSDAVEDGVAVELVKLRLKKRHREGARKRGNALTQRRTMSANHIYTSVL